MDNLPRSRSGLTNEETECLKKLVLWDTSNLVELVDCKRLLEQSLPGICQQVGFLEDSPSFERYLLCAEMFSEIFKPEDCERDEVFI